VRIPAVHALHWRQPLALLPAAAACAAAMPQRPVATAAAAAASDRGAARGCSRCCCCEAAAHAGSSGPAAGCAHGHGASCEHARGVQRVARRVERVLLRLFQPQPHQVPAGAALAQHARAADAAAVLLPAADGRC
jgi:hypothetical protein